MKNRILLILLVVTLTLSVGLISCGGEVVLEYSLTMSSTEGGSVTNPGEGDFAYEEGEVVNLEATPDDYYDFASWTGDLDTIDSASTATTAITMNGDYSVTAHFEEEEPVTFPDPNLEVAIRQTIDIPSGAIYPSDLERLTSLHAWQKNIADLTGLEYCTSLTELYLEYNDISDISPLANLTSLTDLGLGANQISDIEPLVNNPGLSEEDWVDLEANPLSGTSINTYIPQLEARGVTVHY